jgi:hypothetical protein
LVAKALNSSYSPDRWASYRWASYGVGSLVLLYWLIQSIQVVPSTPIAALPPNDNDAAFAPATSKPRPKTTAGGGSRLLPASMHSVNHPSF